MKLPQLRGRRRDALIINLAGQLADSRAREAELAEQLKWHQLALGSELRARPGHTLAPPGEGAGRVTVTDPGRRITGTKGQGPGGHAS